MKGAQSGTCRRHWHKTYPGIDGQSHGDTPRHANWKVIRGRIETSGGGKRETWSIRCDGSFGQLSTRPSLRILRQRHVPSNKQSN